MPRLMSFAKTWPQFVDGSKTVTRRDGWRTLHRGNVIEGVEWSLRHPAMWCCPACGLRTVRDRGRFCACGSWIVHRRPERLPGKEGWRMVRDEEWVRLGDITPEDVAREGFPGRSPKWFVEMYCAPRRPDPGLLVHRIEYEPWAIAEDLRVREMPIDPPHGEPFDA